MLNFVVLWEDRGFFRFFSFVKNAQFCHFVRGPCIFWLLQFCQKCSILSFCERTVNFFASSILSKMLNFVILWEDRGFYGFFNFVKNAQFCHFLRGQCVFSGSSILSQILNIVILKAPYTFFAFSILSKMLNFVIFWKACVFFFHVFNLSKMLNFVILWEDRGFFASSILSFSERPVYFFSRLQFCQKCSILSFCERTVNFFTSSILSKILNVVILWEDRGFFRFFNFVKNAPFCHFVRGSCIFSRLQFCQKCSILSFCERTVFFFSILQFCQKCSILSFSERPVDFFSLFQFCQKLSILSLLKNGLQIMRWV